MRLKLLGFLIGCLSIAVLYFSFWRTPSIIYDKISDIRHPTVKEYELIQRHLSKGERPGLERLKEYQQGCRKIRIIDKSKEQIPGSGIVSVNCSDEERENCILIYASFNRNYPQALKRLVDLISQSDFKGHILYYMGGWPNLEEGDLVYAHVPYAFKLCAFREAQRLGFKRALWLDSSIVPLCSLNDFFSRIQSLGYLAAGNTHMVGPYFNDTAARALGTTLEESFAIPSCSASLLGFDFSNQWARKALDRWFSALHNPDAFYSARPEQNVISVILYQLGMSEWIDYQKIAENRPSIRPDSLVLLDRKFAHSGIENE